jgi:hypothetical protein
MFDAKLAQQIDQSTVEGIEISYPLIQWAYGDAKLAKHGGVEGAGGWFIATSNMPGGVRDDLTASMLKAGWVEDSLTLASGSELAGLYAQQMTFSVINMRKRWRATDGQRTAYFAWGWDEYEKAVAEYGRATSQIHVQVMIKGLEEFSPFVITMSGSAAMAFEGSRKSAGVLTRFQATVVAAANAATRGYRWPYRAFWLTVAAATDGKGRPQFTEVGKGKNTTHVVLPVAVGLPGDLKGVDLDQFALDKAQFLQAQALFGESMDWKAAWDNIAPEKSDVNVSSDERYLSDDLAAVAADAGM